MSEEAAPTELDTTTPSVARCYDALLGGKDNYLVDRQAVNQALAIAPAFGRIAVDNREFLVRASRYLAEQCGVDQFLDCGSGLPTAENTHEVVQPVNPNASVVYLDNDPIVLAHGRALLEDNAHTKLASADFTQPQEVLHNAVVTGHIDLSRPLALYHISTLHHVGPEQRPHEIVSAYIDALPSGSYFVLSHFFDPGEGNPEASELAHRLQQDIFASGLMGRGWFRAREEIEAFFRGLELVEPGVVILADWRPAGSRNAPLTAEQYLALGGVARKP